MDIEEKQRTRIGNSWWTNVYINLEKDYLSSFWIFENYLKFLLVKGVIVQNFKERWRFHPWIVTVVASYNVYIYIYISFSVLFFWYRRIKIESISTNMHSVCFSILTLWCSHQCLVKSHISTGELTLLWDVACCDMELPLWCNIRVVG